MPNGAEMTQSVSTQNNREAEECCRLITSEVVALEQLLAGQASFDEDLDDDLRELWDELASTASEEPSQYVPSLLGYVNSCCLEFTELGERSSATNEWNVVGARLLRTYGDQGEVLGV